MCDPIRFVRADGGKGRLKRLEYIYACGKCGFVCGYSEEAARYHCGGKPCDMCGGPCKPHYWRCDTCMDKVQEKLRAKKRASAEVISAEDHDGYVYWDENGDFFPNITDAMETICYELELNETACKEQTLCPCKEAHLVLDADHIVSSELENSEHHEDAYDQLSHKGLEKLSQFIKKWNEEHGTEVTTLWPDDKKRIDIPDSWWDEMIGDFRREEV